MDLIIFIGIQGSGKSTFYEEHFKGTYIRVNLDTLKTRTKERNLIIKSLLSRSNIVIDNTNPTVIDRKRYISLARNFGYNIYGYYFMADLERSLKRNESRDRVVPKVGVFSTLKKLERPSLSEGFDELFFVRVDTDNKFIVEDWKE
jgi:predicted kinase